MQRIGYVMLINWELVRRPCCGTSLLRVDQRKQIMHIQGRIVNARVPEAFECAAVPVHYFFTFPIWALV